MLLKICSPQREKQVAQMRAEEALVSTPLCVVGGQSIGFATVTIDHKRNTSL